MRVDDVLPKQDTTRMKFLVFFVQCSPGRRPPQHISATTEAADKNSKLRKITPNLHNKYPDLLKITLETP